MKKVSLLIMATFLTVSFMNAQENKLDNNSKNKNKMNIQDEKQSFNEIKNVTKALEPYIKSAKTGDGKLSRSAFFEHAHIVGSIGGTHYNMTADEFGSAVSEGGTSENIQHHIAWIDVSGPAAAAKVEFINWSGVRFTDFFVLYKKDGKWQISGKVYDSHSNN